MAQQVIFVLNVPSVSEQALMMQLLPQPPLRIVPGIRVEVTEVIEGLTLTLTLHGVRVRVGVRILETETHLNSCVFQVYDYCSRYTIIVLGIDLAVIVTVIVTVI